MAKYENPRLCGGTFFVLVLQALRQRISARQHFKEEKDGLTDPEVLMGLIRVVNPDFIEPKKDALKSVTNYFKACQTSKGAYFPFGDTAEAEEFDSRVRTRYTDVLVYMSSFVERFLETGTENKKDVKLVKALIDLVLKDDSIGDNEEFYILDDGSTVSKVAFSDIREVSLPAFLLGIWHYVVINRKDNTVGKETYAAWCPPAGGGPRRYSGGMGKDIKTDIKVYVPEATEPTEQPATEDFEYEEAAQQESQFTSDEPKAETPPPTTQNIYNPLIIQQSGANATVIPNYGTMHLDLGKRGGGSDE